MEKKVNNKDSNSLLEIKISNKNFSRDDIKYLNSLEERDESKLDERFLELFVTLQSTIVIADKISTIMKRTMDEVSDDVIYESTDALAKKLKKSITLYDKISTDINGMVMLIHEFSGSVNYFWKDCPVEVFKSHYELIKKKYIEKYVHSNEIDFLIYEYQYFFNEDDLETNIAHSEVRSNDYLSMLNYKKYFTYDNKQFFALLNTRKKEFLKTQIDKLGYNIEILVIGGKQKVNILESVNSKADDLALSGLPKFNLQQRYELFKKLGFDNTIHTLNTDKQMAKYRILAIILGISHDNAKKIFNGTYKGLSTDDQSALQEYLSYQHVVI